MNAVPSRRVKTRIRRIVRTEVHAFWRRRPITPGTVLYESFSGNGMLCNPEAIFRELLSSSDMGHLRHIWVLSDLRLYAPTIAEFEHDSRVSFVRYGSDGYLKALATSEYLINNATFPPDFSKRAGQKYVNTWHGTPLKKMGYDMNGGAREAANVLRNLMAADYLIAANSTMTDMYWRSYRLAGLYRGTVIEEGYPRIDRQMLDSDSIAHETHRLELAGLNLGSRKIILYAPTWKGTTLSRPEDDLDSLLAYVSALTNLIDQDKYVVLLKAHQSVSRFVQDRLDIRAVLVPNDIPTNVILGLTSVLITDYSSIAYDFLATGRPILYFVPDLDSYSASRGLHVEPGQWPGALCTTVEDLDTALKSAALNEHSAIAERYGSAQQAFVPHEDGHSSRRVVDIIFRGHVDGTRIEQRLPEDRPSILIYLGGMRPNGITTSALSLLTAIDYDKVDVSVFYPASTDPLAIANQLAIDPRARQFPRVGGMNGSKIHQLVRHGLHRLGRTWRYDLGPVQRTLWSDEWNRCFGPATKFDYVVDFSGYGPFWAALLLHAPHAVRSIWLHNDLASDAHRRLHGRRRMLHSLTRIFSLYRNYDNLVSVSEELCNINSAALGAHSESSKFVWAYNSIDSSQIEKNSREPICGPVGDFVSRPDMLTFVTAGRLSPEKNHARLIRAFALVHAHHEATQLLIIGDGALASNLAALVKQLGLDQSVLLAGHHDNPHSLMAAADCFVLSSNYEGQPMVLLEALVLGMPIVTVDFGSVRGSLPLGVGLVVLSTVESLAAGMDRFVRGQVPVSNFDYDKYQDQAIREFYTSVGMTDAHDDPSPVATRGSGL